MQQNKHKVFISYHHANDQWAKETLLVLNEFYDIFIDCSVDTGDIDEDLPADQIREIIRDEYLRDSTVTVLLVGIETKNRKHVDWELYSSMRDGKINKKSGILVIQLPSVAPQYITAAHGDKEKSELYPNETWIHITDRKEYERRYPYLPDRIIDNLMKSTVKISVVKWEDIYQAPEKLRLLIELTFQDKNECEYDLSRTMRDRNS